MQLFNIIFEWHYRAQFIALEVTFTVLFIFRYKVFSTLSLNHHYDGTWLMKPRHTMTQHFFVRQGSECVY